MRKTTGISPRLDRTRGGGRLLAGLGSIALLTLLAIPPAPAAQVTSLRISQAVQTAADPPTVQVYLDLLDADGRPVSDLAAGALEATLGGAVAEVDPPRRLPETGRGVATIFLIDVSRSLSEAEFEPILQALDAWIDSLGPRDRVAAITFGEESRLLLDYTNDYPRARRLLGDLRPTDDLTVLHRALRDGLDLARRRDPGLPGRRVLVVLTDGRDEGSGLTLGDVLSSLRDDPVPIYAVGLSRLRGGERERYLRLLHRLASNSGGVYVEGSTETVGASYATLLEAVRRVWTTTIRCADCPADGASYRLQLQLSQGGRVLADGRPVRIFPSPRPEVGSGSPPSTPPGAAHVAAPDGGSPPDPARDSGAPGSDAEPRVGEPAGERGAAAILPWTLLLVVAVAAALFFFVRRRAVEEARSTRAAEATGPEAEKVSAIGDAAPAGPAGPPYETAPGVLTSRPPKPPSLRLVRLIVVRGNRVGRQYSLMLLERAVVGSRSSCDCVLTDEPGVAPEQFELLQRDGRVYVRNLASSRPTLVDGLPIEERHPLPRETLVGNSDCILRMICDEPRRVPV